MLSFVVVAQLAVQWNVASAYARLELNVVDTRVMESRDPDEIELEKGLDSMIV